MSVTMDSSIVGMTECTSILDMLAPWIDIPNTQAVDHNTLRKLLMEHSRQHPEYIPLIRSTLLTLSLLPDIYLCLPTDNVTEQLEVLDQLFPSSWADEMLGVAATSTKVNDKWKLLFRERLYQALFTYESSSNDMHWRNDMHWLRLVCMWTGWLGESLPESHIQQLLERCSQSWSEKYEDLVICTLMLSAHQLLALAKDKCQHIYQSIKSTGRSRVALALAARYSTVDTAFVRQLLQQTLNISMPISRANFMAFGQMIVAANHDQSSSMTAPLTVHDIQQLTQSARHLSKGQKLDYFDHIVIDILNSKLNQDTQYMKAIDDYIHTRLVIHTNPPSAPFIYLLRKYTNVRVNSVVPDYLPPLLMNSSSRTVHSNKNDTHRQTNKEDTIVIALLLLLLIMESAEKRRQFDALYASGQLLEQVDATWWLTRVCRRRDEFGLIVAPFVALLLVYAAELSTISRCLLDYDEAASDPTQTLVSPRWLMNQLLEQLPVESYRDEQLLQVHLFYTPLLNSATTDEELDHRLKILYLMLLRSQRSMRMLHGLKSNPDSRGMDTFILLQEVFVVRSCLDYCYQRKVTKGNLQSSSNRIIYAFLNDFLTERLPVLKLLHWQGYPIELLDDMLEYMPVMQYCYSFLLEWLDRPDTSTHQPGPSTVFSRKVTRKLLEKIPPRSTRKIPMEAIQQRLQMEAAT